MLVVDGVCVTGGVSVVDGVGMFVLVGVGLNGIEGDDGGVLLGLTPVAAGRVDPNDFEGVGVRVGAREALGEGDFVGDKDRLGVGDIEDVTEGVAEKELDGVGDL